MAGARRVDPLELDLDAVEVLDQIGEIALLGVRLRQLVEVDFREGLEQHREHQARVTPLEPVESDPPARRMVAVVEPPCSDQHNQGAQAVQPPRPRRTRTIRS